MDDDCPAVMFCERGKLLDQQDALRVERDRLRAALTDLLGNCGCMCDHPLVTAPCSKCRAARVLDAPRRNEAS